MKNLANLIDAWVADYSADEFMDEFIKRMTFGELIEAAYWDGVLVDSDLETFVEE